MDEGLAEDGAASAWLGCEHQSRLGLTTFADQLGRDSAQAKVVGGMEKTGLVQAEGEILDAGGAVAARSAE
ncbi:hypothetical protein LH128_01829 [Sphingomonas sp. LH128]|nr:hypothetical protein LH128_01829 [Sphingomonas sp. LH128]